MEDKKFHILFYWRKRNENPFTPLLAVLLISSIFVTANAEEISTPTQKLRYLRVHIVLVRWQRFTAEVIMKLLPVTVHQSQ